MIKINNLEQWNTYTCQHCNKWFKTKKDLKIIPNFSPICSSRCKFGVFYEFLLKQKYSDFDIIIMLKSCGIPEFRDKKGKLRREKAFFDISKYFVNLKSPIIIGGRTRDKPKKKVTNTLSPKQRQEVVTSPPYKGAVTLSLSPDSRGVLSSNLVTINGEKENDRG